MDDFDTVWNEMTGSADYATGEQANTALDWGDVYNSLDSFEQDWLDVTNGRYTIDEVDLNQDIKSDKELLDWVAANSSTGFVSGLVKSLGDGAAGFLKKYLYNPDTGKVNTQGLATAAAALYGMMGGNEIKPQGYNEPVPQMTAVREQVPVDSSGRTGAMGKRYFSDTKFLPSGDAAGIEAARTAAQQQASGIAALQKEREPAVSQEPPRIPTPWNRPESEFRKSSAPRLPRGEGVPRIPAPEELNQQGGIKMAIGGQVPQFKGPLENGGFVVPGDVVRHADPMGTANKERGLAALSQNLGAQAIRGPGTAMSDSIKTTIDGKQPAAVANGEAYIPKQQVKALGGGDEKRGADKLYEMMEKLRLSRTGSTEQINPDNPQELKRAYKNGGIAQFAEGGDVPTPVGYGTSTASTLSPWVGPYVTQALGEAQALAAQPYQAYTGPLTAGPTNMQQQAFAGLGSLATEGYTPTSYEGGTFTSQAAQQYMNPYLSSVLEPQMQEMKRQADIARLSDAARLTQAGAFGGSRQAIMESEGRRNLLDAQRKTLGEGYASAYDKAMGQFNTEQERRLGAEKATEASRQYSAEFGQKSLADLAQLGEQQRQIEQAGLDAARQQFEQEREFAYKMPQYKLGLLQGLPIGFESTTPNQTGLSSLQSQIADLMALYKGLGGQ